MLPAKITEVTIVVFHQTRNRPYIPRKSDAYRLGHRLRFTKADSDASYSQNLHL